MSPAKIFLIYAIVGSVVLFIAMRVFGVRDVLWQPILASVLAGACSFFLPKYVGDLIGFFVTLGVLQATTRAEWNDILYPVLISRAAVFVVMLTQTLSKVAPA